MTTQIAHPPLARPLDAVPHQAEKVDTTWSGLYRVGAVAALTMIALMPVQVVIFVLWPPPLNGTSRDWFALYQDNWVLGLLSLDLLYIVTNVLLIPLYLALYGALRRVSPSAMAVALVVGLVGLAAYFSSTIAFEMWSLSDSYAQATNDAERGPFLAAGEAILARYQGTAFVVYYILNAITLIVTAMVMLRSTVFTKVTGYIGLLAGALMAIPSTFGTLGLVFAFASLVPWAVFSALVARRLFQLGRLSPETGQGVSS